MFLSLPLVGACQHLAHRTSTPTPRDALPWDRDPNDDNSRTLIPQDPRDHEKSDKMENYQKLEKIGEGASLAVCCLLWLPSVWLLPDTMLTQV